MFKHNNSILKLTFSCFSWKLLDSRRILLFKLTSRARRTRTWRQTSCCHRTLMIRTEDTDINILQCELQRLEKYSVWMINCLQWTDEHVTVILECFKSPGNYYLCFNSFFCREFHQKYLSTSYDYDTWQTLQ